MGGKGGALRRRGSTKNSRVSKPFTTVSISGRDRNRFGPETGRLKRTYLYCNEERSSSVYRTNTEWDPFLQTMPVEPTKRLLFGTRPWEVAGHFNEGTRGLL